jgi:hypothetical protein
MTTSAIQLKRVTRLVRGQPEGFIEAFANIYIEAARAISAETSGQRTPEDCDFPNVEDGVAGMAFVETAVEGATPRRVDEDEECLSSG